MNNDLGKVTLAYIYESFLGLIIASIRAHNRGERADAVYAKAMNLYEDYCNAVNRDIEIPKMTPDDEFEDIAEEASNETHSLLDEMRTALMEGKYSESDYSKTFQAIRDALME